MFGDQNNNQDAAEEIWAFLESNKIIENGKIQDLDSMAWRHFPYGPNLQNNIYKFLASSHDLSRGVGQAAVHGAVVGAVMGAISHMAQRHVLKKQVTQDAKARAYDVEHGALGGFLEIDAFVLGADDVAVFVHGDNGHVSVHGSSKAKNQVHLRYSYNEMHYSLIDGSGNEIPVQSNPGDCLFDSLGAAIGESGASIRAKVASTLREQPIDSARGTLLKKAISRKIRMTDNPLLQIRI